MAKEQFIIDKDGKKTAVVVPVKEYRQLMEDLHDLTVVAERRAEPAVSLKDLKRRLKADGVIHD
jgi:PHD/YefM family antitoxin component YafN of YafNO toxin-antitoxin module